MHAAINAIAYHLPETVLSTADLAAEFPEWSVEKIDNKTGIQQRHIAAPGECASDLAVKAAEKLFASGAVTPSGVDYLLLCTQSPDYFLPTTACLIQDRLGLPTHAGALDFNLGCSGFVYGLGLAEGLIASQQASRILLITADTYSKYIDPKDKSVRTIFGDAAAAVLLSAGETEAPLLGPFVYGTDGRGAQNLIVRNGACRTAPGEGSANLFMDGGEIFTFTLDAVPGSVDALLARSGQSLADIDLFVFHQANKFMLDHLCRKLKLPADKFYVAMRHCGNTVSSSIPIALKHAQEEGRLKTGSLVMLVGFGVGYSWGATLVRWVL